MKTEMGRRVIEGTGPVRKGMWINRFRSTASAWPVRCHGGPGITFIPGYNASRQVLADLG